MRVDIKSLSQGINELELVGDAESLDLKECEIVLKAPVRVDLALNVFNEDIRIDGVVRTDCAEECSRCLEDFGRKIEAELHLYAAARSAVGRKNSAGDEEEVDTGEGFILHDGRQLDLREEVRSAILLSSPMKPLCQPDCKGLCPVCGGNLNHGRCSCGPREVDPRWKGLDKLRGQ